MKPGIKTTEFWITLIVVLASSISTSGLLNEAPDALAQICSVIVSAGAAMGYTASRAMVKLND